MIYDYMPDLAPFDQTDKQVPPMCRRSLGAPHRVPDWSIQLFVSVPSRWK